MSDSLSGEVLLVDLVFDLLEAGVLLRCHEITWLEASSIAVEAPEHLRGHLWPLHSLRLAPGLVHVGAERVLQVLRGAASSLELLQLALVLENHCLRVVAITPTPIAHLSEGKIQIGARHTHPVTDALTSLVD